MQNSINIKQRKTKRANSIPVCPKSRFTAVPKTIPEKAENKTYMRQVEKANDSKKTPQDDDDDAGEEEGERAASEMLWKNNKEKCLGI